VSAKLPTRPNDHRLVVFGVESAGGLITLTAVLSSKVFELANGKKARPAENGGIFYICYYTFLTAAAGSYITECLA